MAETQTFTYDPTQDSLIDEANEARDAENLAVGEKMVEEQENLLAGKYKTTEDLEKAYKELEGKLGKQEQGLEREPQTDSESESEPEEEISTQPSPAAELITSANDEFLNNDGKLSPETLDKFSSMSSKELVEAYMQVQGDLQSQQLAGDITQEAINEVKNSAGGEETYQNIVDWASANLDQQSIEAFDSIVNTGSVDAIKIAVKGLQAEYENANGYEGRMVTGKPPTNTH